MRHLSDSGMILAPPKKRDTRSGRLWEAGLAALAFAALLGLVRFGLGAGGPAYGALIAGFLCLGLFLALYFLKKDFLFYPVCLGLAVLLLLFGSVSDGLCAIWNQVGAAYTERTAILLPELQCAASPAAMQLAWGLLGLLLMMVSLLGIRHCRVLTGALLPAAGLAVCLLFRRTSTEGWLSVLILAGIVLPLSAGSQKRGKAFLLSLAAAVLSVALLLGAVSGMATQSVPARVQKSLHHALYEHGDTALPEGDFRDFDPAAHQDGIALTVTMQTPEPQYLRGFTADTFRDGRWEPLAPQVLAEHKQMLYWLYRDGFSPLAQYGAACAPLKLPQNTLTVEAVNACRKYFYIPYSLSSAPAPGSSLQSGFLPADGQAVFSFRTVYAPEAQLEELLKLLQNEDGSMSAFRQAESAYRGFVLETELQLPGEFTEAMGPLLNECCSPYGPADSLTQAQAQASALDFLTRCFGTETVNPDLPLAHLPGSYYQYATAAALALRYYGIPARYAEGYVISPEMAEHAQPGEPISVENSCGQAWVEIYQDGIGWIPMDLTPGFQALAGQQTQAGVKPSGNSDPDGETGTQIGPGDGHHLTEGNEKTDTNAEKSDENDLLAGGGTMVMLKQIFRAVGLTLPVLLVLLLLALVLRKVLADRRRTRGFRDADPSAAAARLFAASAQMLAYMGLDRGTGSMETVCTQAAQRFGEEYGSTCRDMMEINNRTLFSRHPAGEDERSRMYDFYRATLALTKKNIKWYRRVFLRWALCRY